MTTIVARVYPTREAAAAVVATLVSKKFRKSDVDLIDQAGVGLHAALKTAGIYPAAAAVYAEFIAKGHPLVVCRAPFGAATRAIGLMDEAGPVATGVKHGETYREATAPQRQYAMMNIVTVLLKPDTLMLSGGLLPRPLTRGSRIFEKFGIPGLSGTGARTTGLITGRQFFAGIFPPLTSGKPLMTKSVS